MNYFQRGKVVENFFKYVLDDETSFTDAIFFGCERKLFTFELSVFLFVDYFAEDFALATFILLITYYVSSANF